MKQTYVYRIQLVYDDLAAAPWRWWAACHAGDDWEFDGGFATTLHASAVDCLDDLARRWDRWIAETSAEPEKARNE